MSSEKGSTIINPVTLPIFQREPLPKRVTAKSIGIDEIKQIVDIFYDRVQTDPMLGSRFATVSDWSEHKARMTHFWWVTLGGAAYASYRYRVVEAHRAIDVQRDEITYWLCLFSGCIRRSLPKPLAEAWLRCAEAMGKSLSRAADRD